MCWQLIAGTPAPQWVQAALDLLPSAPVAPAVTQGLASATAVLQLEPDMSAASAAGPGFLLTDQQGRALHRAWPLLTDITAGQGIGLMLWQRCHNGGWQPVQKLRLAAACRYREARQELPRAIAMLCSLIKRQDLKPESASIGFVTAVAASGQLTKLAVPRAAQPLGALHRWGCELAGTWRSWLAVQRSRLMREEWRIGIVDTPVQNLLLPEAAPTPAPRWLATPPGLGYWADPMGLGLQPNQLVCEFYSELTGLGHIERLELDAEGKVLHRQRMPVGEGKHVSFPLLAQIDGRLLAIAETAALRECVIHEVDDKGHWHPITTVLQGIAAADPVLFQWQDLYWLAYTDIDIGEMDNLCLQSAPTLQGPWTRHPRNPVKLDIAGARMAGGMLVHQGELYRPAQNCRGVYGASVQIHRILELSPTEFKEEPVRTLLPDPEGPCPHGLHTLSAWGERTLIDGKRYVFSPSVVWWKLKRRLGRSSAP